MEAKVNLDAALASFDELWAPRVVAEPNGQQVRIAKVHGTFCWHRHEDADELFLVWKGRLRIELRREGADDAERVDLAEGELFVVPRGIEHRPIAEEPAEILLFEPADVLNTGNVRDEHTRDTLERL